MAHYIEKEALIVEIERLKVDALQKKSQCKRSGLERIMHQIGAYNKVISLINTLEVKEVDIEKELVDYHNENFSPCNDGTLLTCEGYELTWYDYESIAKHFFELGMQVSNKAQEGE